MSEKGHQLLELQRAELAQSRAKESDAIEIVTDPNPGQTRYVRRSDLAHVTPRPSSHATAAALALQNR